VSDLSVPLERIRACLEGVIPSPFATCSREGAPNVTYLSIVRMVDPGHVALSFQFFSKTRQNLLENPRAQVIVVDPNTLAQYRLDLWYERTETEGPLFEAMRTQLDAIASQTGLSNVFVLRGADVYRVLSCDSVGVPDEPAAGAAGPDALTALDAFTRRIGSCHDLESLFAGTLESLERAFGYAHSFLLLRDEEGRRLFTIASRGYPASGVGSEVVLGQGLLGVAARQRTTVRSTNLARDLALSRAVRTTAEQEGQGDALQREIPLPGLDHTMSQLAVPLVCQDELLGLLCVQSGQAGRFLESDARLAEIAARHVASALALLQAEADRAPEAALRPPPPPPAEPGTAQIRHYESDDSIFVDDVYLIKGVAGRILWKLLRSYVEEGRREFSNKEVRLDKALQLPDIKDNLETRLILLRRRLEERCAFLRIARCGRGRFGLQVGRELRLENIA
jgi:adenylate cyclase